MLVPLGKEKVVLYSEIAGMIVDIILNALLILKWHLQVQTIGTLAAEIAVLLFSTLRLEELLRKHIDRFIMLQLAVLF